MILRRGAITVFVVAVLIMGAATTVACTKAEDDPSQAGVSETETVDDSSEEGAADQGDSDSYDGTEDADGSGDQNDPASSEDSISSQELAAIGAELAAMEAELDAIVFPDDDFSEIESMLGQ